MKNIFAFFVLMSLFLINGCASTGNVGIGEVQPHDGQIATKDDVGSYSTETKNRITAKRSNRSLKGSDSKTEGITESIEDDDIATLIEHDYYKEFDIPIVFNDAVKYFIQYFTTEKRKVFGNWLKRSRYYIPLMKEILKEQGLPEDLVYLAMIESGFNPKAYSPAKACGPWQFIYETGGRYGLKVNYWIDERRDPEKSTVAATKYLKDLFNQFGCWYLAAAGYNSGEKRVERAVEKHGTNDFWEIVKYNTLPRETREYIPKLIAAAIIAKDPERYGFGSIVYDEPIRFSLIKVPAGSPLVAIARSASIDLAALRQTNPEILRGITPPDMDNYEVKLPYNIDKNRFSDNLENLLSDSRRVKGFITYKVKKRDTLAGILKRFKISYEEMQLVNHPEEELKIKSGMVVSIPRFKGQSMAEATLLAQKPSQPIKDAEKKSSPKKVVKLDDRTKTNNQAKHDKQNNQVSRKKSETIEAKTYHIVQKGETLSSISNKYGIDISRLRASNNLKNDKVYPKMKLNLASYTTKKPRSMSKIHIVQKGETLSSISNKYGI
ncbi:MAG TPA: LysM peptidoglycan-binding domain-containing protein, partial [Syntrophorhabdaceae bacterium]|nr:LysM peptidoglycan-binding domain-containing protein [Syntrophorhabdaceae bacterium]